MCFLQRHVFSFVCLPTGLSNSCQDFLSLTVWLPELLLVLLISVDLFLPLLSFLFLHCVGRMHFFLYPAILQPGLFLISGNAWCAWLLFAWEFSFRRGFQSRCIWLSTRHCVIWKKLTSRFLAFLICLSSIMTVPASWGYGEDSAGDLCKVLTNA